MGRLRAGVEKLHPVIVYLTLVTSNRSVSRSKRSIGWLCLFCNDNMVLDERWNGTHRKWGLFWEGEVGLDEMDGTLPVQVRLHVYLTIPQLIRGFCFFSTRLSLNRFEPDKCKNQLYLSLLTRIPPHSSKL